MIFLILVDIVYNIIYNMPKYTIAQQKSYAFYKESEGKARIAAMKGECLLAERLFLQAAKGRKQHCLRYNGGTWDAGHKARYDICVGSAWIQRECYENDKLEDEITYERQGKQPKRVWNVWRNTNKTQKKDEFASLLNKHAEIKSRRSALKRN